MSNAQKIRSTINSTKSTSKITKAMQLVAASKLGKNQARMNKSRPYVEKIRQVIGHIAMADTAYVHPYMRTTAGDAKGQAVGYVVVSTDRGLCGGLNTNLFKAVVMDLKRNQEAGQSSRLCLVGNKASSFFRNVKATVLAEATHLGDTPHLADLIGLVKVMLDAYNAGELARICIASNQFVNVMIQKPRILPLLPLVPDKHGLDPAQCVQNGVTWDYLYEPDPKTLLDVLLVRYIESLLYQAVIENILCEQAARMMAMRSATDNADAIIQELVLAYNKARQAAITQELAEISAGAQAI